MRRKEFAIQDQQEVEEFLGEMTFGFLGMNGTDDWPHVIPLNFVYKNGAIYFHGSRSGQKMKNFAQDDRVTFVVAREYALIPSYYQDPVYACPATSYFKSVHIKGKVVIVEDLEEKAMALEAFMKKLQPEGGYEEINSKHEGYISRLQGVAVLKIQIEECTAKFKFGQNLKEEAYHKIVSGLEHRGSSMDEETIAMMKKYCPYHQTN